ncbi:aminomethyl-transferring glycine dehydrogenase subunit GcvPB [Vagococcus elongatus]|uniref:glycine dehydrogenase (aminomethyl-transferring) n=1 Tax=Vagococcus elongatus TaxID=180344 RepID=A0A430B5J9_9ENTE|nr:aminomethyl-transferring glycine dehydrogenase subunit GcvPB [Vagococcus elongatus]RSU15522.1 glycine dehydrogenase subunit 2 [Vagococcus elongatus]
MGQDQETLLRDFHQARWSEPIIYEMSTPGERGVITPAVDKKIKDKLRNKENMIPESLKRKKMVDLPEIGQMRVNRHYMRLSQETLGNDVSVDIGQGTCTMKYSPKVQEHLVSRNSNIASVHPYQDESTIQGLLEIYYKTEQYLKEISGMDAFSFQPGGGAQAIYTNAVIVRKYFEDKGEDRDEIVTTIFSHPADAGAPATCGYKVIDLMHDKDQGYPTLEAFKAALSEKTAAIFITNPEDTGIFNPRIKEYVDAAHEVGAVAVYDQANVNGIMGITRAKEAGFDLIHYNLHKTFSAPHGGMGPGVGALGARGVFKDYIPVPKVSFDGEKYLLEHEVKQSIGKVRSFIGNAAIIVRVYMWLRSLGADGVREAAKCAVLNNQYAIKKISQIRGVTMYYAEGKRRIEQCRYSWEQMKEETGLGTEDVQRRLVDYSMEHYWESHHPHIVPEPFTLEPTDSYSKKDVDEFIAVLEKISWECYNDPEVIRTAPHNAPCHGIKNYYESDPANVICSWRQYKKKYGID